MEWVETTAKSVEEAKDLLLDRLGVDEEEAEFEVVEEPKVGLFGRPRGEARVRARVKPKSPRPKNERRRQRSPRRGRGSGGGSSQPEAADESERPEPKQQASAGAGRGPAPAAAERQPSGERRGPDRSGESLEPAAAVDTVRSFLEGVVAAFGVEAAVDAAVVDDEVHATVQGDQLGRLIGPKGGVIDALQELTRTASQKVAQGRSVPRIRVDVGSFRSDRRAALETFAREVAEEVRDTGEARALEPMGSVDRKIVHDAAGEVSGVETTSEGDDPDRRVVIEKA